MIYVSLNFHVHVLPSTLVCKKLSTYEYIRIQSEKEREQIALKQANTLLSRLKGRKVGYPCPYFILHSYLYIPIIFLQTLGS